MIPHSENKKEPTKRTMLVGALLLVLVNLGAAPGFLRSPNAPLANKRAAIQRVLDGSPGGLLTEERSASTDPATAFRVVPAPEPPPYLSVGHTPAAWAPGAGESLLGDPGSTGLVSAAAAQPPLSPIDRIRAQRPAAYLMARAGRPLVVVGTTTVIGWAREADNAPVRRARLQLRNVVTGYIEAMAVADDAGEFSFEGFEGGTYVVELVDDGNDVLGVGQVFNVAPGETVATFLKLAEAPSFVTGLFQNTASSVLSAAAGAGVIGVVPTGDPTSPE